MSTRFVINVTSLDGDRYFSTNRAADLNTGNIDATIVRMQRGFPESEGFKVEAFEITRGDTVVTPRPIGGNNLPASTAEVKEALQG